MRDGTAGGGRSLRTATGSVLALTVVVAAALLTGPATDHGSTAGARPDAPERSTERPPTTLPATAATRVGRAAEAPTSVVLPGGERVPVRPVSTRTDGVLDVPEDVRVAGWWRGGARLGDPFGATLVAAHVDSRRQGLGPYAALLGTRPGQRFEVRSAHLRQHFRARSLRLVAQGPLPARSRIYAARGPRRLVLVTCAPPYVPERGGYQRLAVVTAVPVDRPHARSHR